MVGKLNLNDTRFNYSHKGFTSIVNQIIELAKIHFDIYKNYNVIVEDYQLLDLFDNVYQINPTDITYEVSPIFFDNFYNGFYNDAKTAHTLVNIEDLKTRNPFNFLTIKNDILIKFEDTKKKYFGNDKILGVQIRGTDKQTELPKISIENVLNKIDEAFYEDTSLNKIFVATDEYIYLSAIINKYGYEKVIYNTNNTISYDGKPLHMSPNRNKINFEVMSDVYLLSRCDYILYSFSNVSFLALSMVNDYNKPFKNLNL